MRNRVIARSCFNQSAFLPTFSKHCCHCQHKSLTLERCSFIESRSSFLLGFGANPVDARQGRGVRSVEQTGPCIHPAALNHIGREARRICVWLAVKTPQGEEGAKNKNERDEKTARTTTDWKVVLKTRGEKVDRGKKKSTSLQWTTIRNLYDVVYWHRTKQGIREINLFAEV